MLSDRQLQSLKEHVEAVPDVSGLRHPMATLLTIVLAARLAGRSTVTKNSEFGRAMSN